MIYNDLPDRIKDEIARIGKPPSLQELHAMAQSINVHCWEHKSEISHQIKAALAQKKSEGKSFTTPSKTTLSTTTPTTGKGKQA